MPDFTEGLRRRLIAKYGTQIDLSTQHQVIGDLLTEIAGELGAGKVLDTKGYDKSYSEGYNKEDYSRASYSRYDKTYDTLDWRTILEHPDFDLALLKRLRDPAFQVKVNEK